MSTLFVAKSVCRAVAASAFTRDLEFKIIHLGIILGRDGFGLRF